MNPITVDSSPPKKRKKRLPLVPTPSDHGLTRVSSLPSEPLEDTGSTTSVSILNMQQPSSPTTHSLATMPIDQTNLLIVPNFVSVTAECPPKGKKTTSNGRSRTCKDCSPITKSSQTLARESTSEGKGCVPSWSLQAKDMSPKLWLPTETDCVDSHSNWWSGSFNSMESNSWFSIKSWTPRDKASLQRTSSPSSTFSIAESMANENTKSQKKRTSKVKKSSKPVANRSKKVQLKPNPETASVLRKWFGCVRHTYNWALGCIKSKPKEYRTNAIWLRKRFVNECNIPTSKRYLLDCPKHIRDSAVYDLAEAYTSNFKKRAKDPSHTFEIKYRKRTECQSITLPSDAIKKTWDVENKEFSMFPTYLTNKIKFHVRKQRTVPEEIRYDCKLLLDKLGRFSLVIVYHEPPCENQAGESSGEDRWCSIDPGVRTMLTVYSPTPGVCYKVGDKDINRIFRLCKGLDKLISLTEAEKHRIRRKRKQKSIIRLRETIRNLVTEVHCKAINFILASFNKIILPPFQVSQMVKRTERRIRSKTVRQMICWRHYAFKQRLLDVATRRPDVEVFVRGEEYTSKTCTHCQTVKHNLGGSKHYRCSHCGLLADRDVCGARNIFLKNALGSNT